MPSLNILTPSFKLEHVYHLVQLVQIYPPRYYQLMFKLKDIMMSNSAHFIKRTNFENFIKRISLGFKFHQINRARSLTTPEQKGTLSLGFSPSNKRRLGLRYTKKRTEPSSNIFGSDSIAAPTLWPFSSANGVKNPLLWLTMHETLNQK